MFDNKYFQWNQKRIKGIVDFYGHKFFYYKKILDLGCGYGDMGGVLFRLGSAVTAVDARQEHLKMVNKKFQGIKTVKTNLDGAWPFTNQKFDLILDLGLLCHLSDYEAHIKSVCASCTHLVLETAVCDSTDPQKNIIINEDKGTYDLSFSGRGCRPSIAAIERVLKECGMNFKRIENSKFNTDSYKYDWIPLNNGSTSLEKRKIWFCVKETSPIQFAKEPEIIVKSPIPQISYPDLNQKNENKTSINQNIKPASNPIPTIAIDSYPLIIEYKSIINSSDLETQIIKNKIDLKNTTFIIPICVESKDMAANAQITLSYLCKYLNTNIIIYEYDKVSKLFDIAKDINTYGNKIEHIFVENKTDNNIFHRTKFLNEMLIKVKTPVVVNYDVDILLPPSSYKKFSTLIINGSDLVYPYFWVGHTRQINYLGRNKISKSLSLDSLNSSDYLIGDSQYGHCQFFNTESYIKGGMENEEFISWGPEDRERGYRFEKLGYNVMWSNSQSDFIYHLEHSRGANSSINNPFMKNNDNLFEYLKSLSKEKLQEYYLNIGYIKKYTGIKL